MYVEKDNNGAIIIQQMTKEDAEMMVLCICSYFADKSLRDRNDAERQMIMLKRELEKNY